SRNGTWARALTVLHAAAREADGRIEATPSMVVIDTHLARGASKVASRSTTAEAPTATPKAPSASWRSTRPDSRWVRSSCRPPRNENRTTELMLEHLTEQASLGGSSWSWWLRAARC